MNLIPRDLAARLGRETVAISDAGRYTAPSGRSVDIREALDIARAKTIEYPPDRSLPPIAPGTRPTRFAVENATVLDVGRRMRERGPVAALNFASAESPGGGFLNGARAQEESLARSSGLVHCLHGRRMYAYHGATSDAMYSDWVIYSRNVPVFRTDEGELLEVPWRMSIVTCPAPHARELRRFAPERVKDIPRVMRKRTSKVLATFAAHAHRRLVLGAWGCGAFGLDAEMMAEIFRDALTTEYRGVFDEIAFAIIDWSEDRHFIGPFERAFPDGHPTTGSPALRTPIAGSYWLVEGQLLAGEYPGAADEEATRRNLVAILGSGIRCFIDLTEARDPLEPYEQVLRNVARELGIDVTYQRIAIRDMSVPTIDLMAEILGIIQSEIASGRPVYFHCMGGLGRTGTVAACWLIDQGHTSDRALRMLNGLRASMPDGWRESPQTDAQRAFVRAWHLQ